MPPFSSSRAVTQFTSFREAYTAQPVLCPSLKMLRLALAILLVATSSLLPSTLGLAIGAEADEPAFLTQSNEGQI